LHQAHNSLNAVAQSETDRGEMKDEILKHLQNGGKKCSTFTGGNEQDG
jgi:hypothetical protein